MSLETIDVVPLEEENHPIKGITHGKQLFSIDTAAAPAIINIIK